MQRPDTSFSREDYSFASRLLHALALNKFVAEASLDVERAVHGKIAKNVSEERHVFVSGLARAGTTILMRQLYATGCFYSLTYRDMPFVLAPNLWRTMSAKSQKEGVLHERAHGDGLDHSFDSPEALEEVFWRVFCGKQYIRKDRLVPMRADAETLKNFRTYVALVLKDSEDRRYLSKNNNNILRLSSIAQAFPNAAILIPFREPLAHANSLLTQHKRFLTTHAEDAFSLKYMRWLAHHEFGADHRPFVFDARNRLDGNPGQLDYWVQLWIHVYSVLLDNLPSNALPVSYERLCEETNAVWNSLCEQLHLECKNVPGLLRPPNKIEVTLNNPELAKQAAELHAALLERAI